jgi:PAS domain S-box-containing protein
VGNADRPNDVSSGGDPATNATPTSIETGYERLFDSIPVGVIEQDYSRVKAYITDLQASGVGDVRGYFETHAGELTECASLIRIVNVNQTAVDILRADSREHLIEAMTKQIAAGPTTQLLEIMQAVAEGQQQRAREVEAMTFKGSPVTLSLSTVVVRGFEKTYRRMLTTMTDITHLRETERALAESEAKFEAIADASPVGIYLYDREARVQYVNPAAVRLTGLPREQILGRGWESAIHPGDLDRLKEEVANQLAQGKGFEGKGRFLHADGRVVWWEAEAAPVALPGDIEGYVSVVQDVSDRIESERALHDSQALLRGVMESLPSPTVVRSPSGEFLFANGAAGAVLGVPAARIPGMTLHELLPADVAVDTARKDQEVLARGMPVRAEEVYFRDGRRYVLDVLRFPVLDASGETIALCVTATDITERLSLDEQKREQRKQLAEDIHDDSVQVMASIALQLETLAKIAESDPRTAASLMAQAESVRVATRRLRDLMLDLGADIFGEEGVVAGLERLAAGVRSDHSIDVAVRRPDVFAMPLRLESLLLRNAREALVNVVKHSGASSVQIELSMQQGGVELSISDDGGGFDPSTEPARGHLGIPSMRERTESVGGRFSISSTPGSGTSVRFWLPTGPGAPVSHSTAAG